MINREKRRDVEILVLSDIHLGTYGCNARQLLRYLKSINPKTLILNGDIIDIWQFSKRYWPDSHMQVIKHFLSLVENKTEVFYVTGNHDEMLRKFSGFQMGTLKIVDKVVLTLENSKKAWFFHGDVFDVVMQHSKWLAKLGALGYDTLIHINRFVNYFSEKIFKRGKLSFSKRIKNSVKGAVKFINKFEKTAAEIGISNRYDYVVCGHIHQPEIREIKTQQGSITYLNSGDWVENLSALEYMDGKWSMYKYNEVEHDALPIETIPSNEELFENMLAQFNLMNPSLS